MIPRTLKHFNVFVDGTSYVGRVTEGSLPKLALKTEEYRAGGMDAPVELDMGMDKMECSFALAEYSADVLALFGVASLAPVSLVFRGGMTDESGEVVAVAATIKGKMREMDPGSWKAGDKSEMKCTVACVYCKLDVGGRVVHEIDVVGMTRVIDGVDQLAAMRAAIGL